MDWRSPCLQSEDELAPYFSKTTKELLGPNPKCQLVNTENDLTVNVFRGHRTAFSFRASISNYTFVAENIDTFDVELISGSYLAPAVMKMAIAKAYQRGLNSMTAEGVVVNGFSFWPHNGALPVTRFNQLHRHMRDGTFARSLTELLTDKKHKPPIADSLGAGVAQAMLTHCTTHPMRTFQFASQIRTPIGNIPFFKFFPYALDCLYNEQTIYLGEPVTRSILEARLGPLPPFKDTSPITVRETPVYNRFMNLRP